MSQTKRTRHTASYLLSHFLNSKDSIEQFPWLTGSLVSILRYIYDVMEMSYAQTNLLICTKSIRHISIYSRTGRATTTRGLSLFVKNKLLSIERKKPRSPTHYGIGEVIQTRLTMSLDLCTEDSTRLTTSLALGSPRAYENPNKAHSEPLVINACKKDYKKKRERKPRAPLLSVDDSFEPDQERKIKCINSGHELNLMIQKFIAFSKAYGKQYEDLQCAFELFVFNEKINGKAKVKRSEVESKSTYVVEKEDLCPGCRCPKIYCRCAHRREEGSRKIQEIMKKFDL